MLSIWDAVPDPDCLHYFGPNLPELKHKLRLAEMLGSVGKNAMPWYSWEELC